MSLRVAKRPSPLELVDDFSSAFLVLRAETQNDDPRILLTELHRRCCGVAVVHGCRALEKANDESGTASRFGRLRMAPRADAVIQAARAVEKIASRVCSASHPSQAQQALNVTAPMSPALIQ
jgi:hypothetical protein